MRSKCFKVNQAMVFCYNRSNGLKQVPEGKSLVGPVLHSMLVFS